ncbi:MAG: hypothetical protein OXF90_10585 [Chloroflexi bacterium]|nr:hypothetical protein [Chloroflexota bacterium]
MMAVDISSADGALLVSLLRLLHIVASVIWVGAALLMTMYIEPMAAGSGAGFLRHLYRDTSLRRLVPLAALVSTVAGLLLYEMLGYSGALGNPTGLTLTAGASFGLLAFLHGLFAVWRPAGRYAGALRSAGADEAELTRMEDKIRRNGRVSMWLAMISLILMAGARYIGPILG